MPPLIDCTGEGHAFAYGADAGSTHGRDATPCATELLCRARPEDLDINRAGGGARAAVARTTPVEEAKKSTEGLSLFNNASNATTSRCASSTRWPQGRRFQQAVLEHAVLLEDRIGEEGKGLRVILHLAEPRAHLDWAGGLGVGRAAMARAGIRKERSCSVGRRQDTGDPAPARQKLDGGEGRPPVMLKAAACAIAGEPAG